MNLVILGPQGCGKGTQAEMLKNKFGLFHVEMGSALREVAKEDSELGRKVNEIVNIKRELVSNHLASEVLHNELKKDVDGKDLVLDGAPRRLDQIPLVEKVLKENNKKLDKVIYIHISETDSVVRISKRYHCSKCGSRLILGRDVQNPTDKCHNCGGKIEQRPDDTVQGVRRRLEIFRQETVPVIDYYRKKGMLIEIDGTKSVERVFAQILAKLEEK
jgi:adenylate kinase